MAKPTAQQMTALATQIRDAALIICGSCPVAALALIQAQAQLEAHVLNEHAITNEHRETFDADVERMKAAAIRGLEKTRALQDTRIETNSAGGSC
jgi:hypothetical protein